MGSSGPLADLARAHFADYIRGAAVGLAVGAAVGLAVGAAVGLAVGLAVGAAVTATVAVGVAVGAAVGALVGTAVACGVLEAASNSCISELSSCGGLIGRPGAAGGASELPQAVRTPKATVNQREIVDIGGSYTGAVASPIQISVTRRFANLELDGFLGCRVRCVV